MSFRPLRVFAFVSALSGLLLSGTAFARVSTVGTSSFANVQVSHDSYKAHSEPQVAENPTNPNDLVAGSKFFTDPAHYQFKIGSFYSSDAGRTWHDQGLLPGFGGYATTSDIAFAFSRSGLAYAVVLACGPLNCPAHLSSSGIFVLRSRNSGKTWSHPVPVFLDTTGATFSDKPWIAVDTSNGPHKGTVYVAWNLDSNSSSSLGGDLRAPQLAPRIRARQTAGDPAAGIVVARSTDYGRSFSPPVNVFAFSQVQFGLGAIPAVGPDGTVNVAFAEYHSEGNQTIYDMENVTSMDGGLTFSAPRVAAAAMTPLPSQLPNGTFRNFSLPTMTASPRDGSLVMAWADERNGDADVFATRSRDRGRTWSAPARVNHDRLRNHKDQFMPVCAAAPSGVFTCAWFDRRDDPNNQLIDVYIAQSTNDGLTFGKNIRVTHQSWDPAIGAPHDGNSPNETFIGDYQGLAVDNLAVHPLWNDTQNGQSQQIRTAVLPIRVFAR